MASPIRLLFAVCLIFLPLLASAQLRIEIIDGVEGAMPIGVVPFAWESEMPQPAEAVHEIISANLARSGLFDPMAEDAMIERPTRPPEVRFGTWRLLKVDHILIGRVLDAPDGIGQEIEYHLLDVHSGRILLSQALPVAPGDLRFGAHRVTDAVYEALIGVPGAFATRIAYVVVTDIGGPDELFELVVADADGFNPQTVVRNTQPIMSPTWAPDGRRLAYVSFATGRSNIIVQDLFTGQTEVVSSSRGINGAPAFSPDGRRLAVSLSQGGSPNIWIIDLDTGARRQLTRHWSISTEPVWSPDGDRIYFTSDRAGRPQIHVMDSNGGEAERVTWEGQYNARASIGLEERFLATVYSDGDNDFRIAIHDRETERLRVLSNGRLDESPSFAPNGSMVLYGAREDGRGVLAAVSADGRIRQRLVASEGDVREPAWSPILR
ncbi:MAG: Tol-Pal system beta propeller repeat protein TolB [Wenzhouxiangella sp.]|jgi:TolB protein|nr:Tol-Pal system beta propeller repeat protein TolB [Wenzhouxiangella sp.]